MKNPVKSLCGGALFAAAICAVGVFSTGCEWESSGSEGSWNDRMSWINFSGLYRSGSGSRALVSNFSINSGGTGDDDANTDDLNEFPVSSQNGPVKPSPFTVIEDVINFLNRGTAGWTLKPGSINIAIRGTTTGPVGSFTDNGAGVLSGTYSQVPGGPSFAGSGTINYDTGAWSLTLSPPDPFIEPAQVIYTYVVLQDPNAEGGSLEEDTEEAPTSYGWVYTLQVVQTGNRLSFTDNRGFVWEGVLSSVTTPAGDDSGRSPGDVVGTFDMKGVTDSRYKITGTFSGSYRVFSPEDGVTYGQLTLRRIQGIWMEPSGQGDLYGETSDAEQAAVAPPRPQRIKQSSRPRIWRDGLNPVRASGGSG